MGGGGPRLGLPALFSSSVRSSVDKKKNKKNVCLKRCAAVLPLGRRIALSGVGFHLAPLLPPHLLFPLLPLQPARWAAGWGETVEMNGLLRAGLHPASVHESPGKKTDTGCLVSGQGLVTSSVRVRGSCEAGGRENCRLLPI